jgi:hypothetical protein
MFTDHLPDCHNPQHIKILRATASRRVQGMLAGVPVRAFTHWYRNKTLPCCQSCRVECPLCTRGLSKRYYAYYPIRNSRGLTAAVELTATAEAQLLDHLHQSNAWEVPIITVSRPAGKKNNPLAVDCEYRTLSEEDFVKFCDKQIDEDLVKRALCRLWNVPEYGNEFKEDEYLQIVANYLKEMIEGNV